MRFGGLAFLALSVLAVLDRPLGALDAAAPGFGQAQFTLMNAPAPPPSSSACGFSLIARGSGPQVAVMDQGLTLLASVRDGEEVGAAVRVQGVTPPFTLTAEVKLVCGQEAEVGVSLDERNSPGVILRQGAARQLKVSGDGAGQAAIRLRTVAKSGEAAVLWRGVRLNVGNRSWDVPILPAGGGTGQGPPAILPPLRPPIELALIEWDWRMQDGIGTQRSPGTYASAAEQTLRRGDDLIRDLRSDGVAPGDDSRQWEELWREWKGLSAVAATPQAQWEDLWRRVHFLRRRIALGNPLARVSPLLLVKQVPGCFSHQLTQYYGRYARPGGGIFVLEAPGKSMRCRQLAVGALPEGSCQHPEVSYDAGRVLFSYCQADTAPRNTIEGHRGRYYHLYEMAADGSNVRRLTDGAFDDFAPRYLPNGQIVFISTRRLGWHRCGNPGCENYTLAVANADGSQPRVLSCHETQEWDPAVLDDGRIIYTRWDYVDRHAVYYEQLWTVRPDGSAPTAFYGNNTFNPVGIWEARQVPLSRRVMATAAAHHAMTAGSIILVDVAKGVDGPGPLTRLTPDVPFPESEALLLPSWRGSVSAEPPVVTAEALRWPGHCYRSPYPLSEKYFLAAYSFDPLVGEPRANAANMFGIYLVDCWGNKELLYRDLNIASVWPVPLRPRRRPSVLSSPPVLSLPPVQGAAQEGLFFLQNVHESAPALPKGLVKRLRVVQVLPKSTPGINRPSVGLPNASPGRQVLGTVPVEADGSAWFRAPSGIPLSFQALDEQGQAVQIMRSITYVQPGEVASCIGCHEPRTTAPPRRPPSLALSRPPSPITPGPDGSKPLSYPILVQPVLDRHCVSCHSGEKPKANVVLTAKPEGHYTRSYNALARRVPFSAWTLGDPRRANSEPVSTPGFFGARGSRLMQMLLKGHNKVALTAEEIERLSTWMDANALFYGTFDPEDQARQQRGERIEGPKLQ